MKIFFLPTMLLFLAFFFLAAPDQPFAERRVILPDHHDTYAPLFQQPQKQPSSRSMPEPTISFDGISNVNQSYPPDPQGDVGPNHYVQVVNLSFAVWDKTGTLLYGPADLNSLWEGFDGPCEHLNNGDPIVLYDHLADRWLLSRFALPNGKFDGPYYQCVAISKTPDPTGAWHRYAYKTSDKKFNDYPKFGVWPDGYYMSVNQFESGVWAGAGVAAFERDKMIQGMDARMIYFDLEATNSRLGGMLPSDLDGPPPPVGTPNYFVQFDDDAWDYPQDQLEIWTFRANWSAPEQARFENIALLPTAPFDSDLCGYQRECVPQPDQAPGLDAISDRLMFRLQYRNFVDYQTLAANHSVDVDGTDHAGVRWYELRNNGQGWAIRQQGTFAPDENHRWMGSLAMDRCGNMALGHSLSGESMYPSLAYAGRLAGDPLNQLSQGEKILIEGSGAQVSSHNRWGDYSMMSVDPVDGCTFWFTGEYYAHSEPGKWQTRIGSFRFPSCVDGPGGELSGRITDSEGNPIKDARILTDAATTFSDKNGRYRFAYLPAGVYVITATAYGHNSLSATVKILAEGSSHQDFVLASLPFFSIQGRVKDDQTGWPLYAELKWSAPGFLQTLFTDPGSGEYQIDLFDGVEYAVVIRSLIPGYEPYAQTIVAPVGNSIIPDFALTADASCSAPGYGVFLETFDFCAPTSQWAFGTSAETGIVRQFSIMGKEGNRTGGTGCFASSGGNDLDEFAADAWLTSASIDCSKLDNAVLSFKYDYQTVTGEDSAEVDVSPDDGNTWINIWQSPDKNDDGPNLAVIDITEQAAGNISVQVRFRHQNAFQQKEWQIDDIVISAGPVACTAPETGGLAVGHVFNAATGKPINGAIIASDFGNSTQSMTTPDDPAVDDGFYALYIPSKGSRLRATKPHFFPNIQTASSSESGVVSMDFALEGAYLSSDPDNLTIEAPPDGETSARFTLSNSGGVYATFAISVVAPDGNSTNAAPWLSVSPEEGVIAAGESVRVKASVQAPAGGETGEQFDAVIAINVLGALDPIQVPVVVSIADRHLPEDDIAITARDKEVIIDVLANDYLISSLEETKLELAVAPIYGTAQIQGQTISYTPDPGYIGTDRFVYSLDGIRADVDLQIWDQATKNRLETHGTIPDGSGTCLTSTITVLNPPNPSGVNDRSHAPAWERRGSVSLEEACVSAVESVRLTLTLRHPFLSDISAWLISPEGNRVLVFEDLIGQDLIETTWDDLSPVAAADGFAPYTGSFQPLQSFDAFIGRPGLGEWTLEIMDHAQLDAGRLIDWTLDIFYSDVTVITVDTTADSPLDAMLDDGQCGLREAVQAANNDAPISGCPAGGRRDLIRLPAGVFKLTLEGSNENKNQTGDLDIRASGSVEIQGVGKSETVLETDIDDRLVHIINSDVTLSHLAIQGGFVDPDVISLVGGGGILNQTGVLRIDHCKITGNTAGLGGGIHNDRGRLTIRSSRIVNNQGENGGGLLDTFGWTKIMDSVVNNNQANMEGGGVDSLGGQIIIHGSTIADNRAEQGGGGLHNQFGDLIAAASTISGNQAIDGGGIQNSAGTVLLRFVSVIDNEALGNGGGLSNLEGTLELKNSLIADNRLQVDFDSMDIAGRIVSRGGNLIGNSAGGLGYRLHQDILDSAPLVGPLADLGGPTPVHALQINSPGMDALACDRFEPDQLGAIRPVGGRCDIGAFEHEKRSYPPAAENDQVLSRGNPVRINVLANDGDPNGDPLAVSLINPPEHGTIRLDGTDLIYTPNSGFIGKDSFQYEISDGEFKDTAEVAIVLEANTPPSVRDDRVDAYQNGWVVIDALANDSDLDSDILTIRSSDAPEHGSAFAADNRIYYFPAPGFTGQDHFIYRAGDGIDAEEAQVTVTVWETDAVIRVDTLTDDMAEDGRCSLREAIMAAGLWAPVDGCAAGGFQSIVSLPTGVLSLTDSPDQAESLTGDLDIAPGQSSRIILQGHPLGGTVIESAPGHRAIHIHQGAEAAIQDLTIRGSEDGQDAAINGGILNKGFLRVVGSTLTRNRGEQGGAIFNSGHFIAQNATFSTNKATQHGGGIFNEGLAIFSFATIAFNYAVYDGGGIHTASGQCQIKNTLIASNSAGRRGPNAWGPVDSLDGQNGDILNMDPLLIPLADNGGPAPTHAIRIDSPAVDAAADCTGADGGRIFTDQRAIQRPKGDACDIGAFEHDGAYYPPAAQDDRAVALNDRSVVVLVLENDGSPGALPLFITKVSPPLHGEAVNNLNGSVTYTPNPGFVGTDLFEYTVSDKTAVDTAKVEIEVVPNQPPVAQDDAAETFQGETVAVKVLENDSDPDGFALFVADVGKPAHGTASTNGAVVTYTPDRDFSGIDAFAYHVSDGTQTDKALVTVTVTGVTLADVLTALKVLAGIDSDSLHLERLAPFLRLHEKIDMEVVVRALRNLARQ